MTRCKGCKDLYCHYHGQPAGMGRLKGGHVCPVKCETSLQYQQNCSGDVTKCPYCKAEMCRYHHKPVSHALVLKGGHVCSVKTTGGAAVNATAKVAGVAAGAVGMGAAVALTGGGALAVGIGVAGGMAASGAVKQVAGGIACDTTNVTKGMCEGREEKCPYCPYQYCRYHREPVADIATVVGGHCCEGKTKGAAAGNIVGGVIEVGVAAAAIVAGAGAVQGGMAAGAGVVAGAKGAKGVYDVGAGAKGAIDGVKRAT